MSLEQASNNSKGGINSVQPSSQNSKITQIIKRKTNQEDDDFDFGDNYSQSSNTQFILQNDQRDSRSSVKNGRISESKMNDSNLQNDGGMSTIDANFLHNVNNEVNYLITKFQDDYVSQRQDIASKVKSIEVQNQRNEIIQKHKDEKSFPTQNENESHNTRFKQEKVASHQLETSNAKKVVPPLTGSNQVSQRVLANNGSFNQEDAQSNSNIATQFQHYNSGLLSNSDNSDRMRTADYQIRQGIQAQTGKQSQHENHFQKEADLSNLDSISQTILVNNNRKAFDESSHIYANSNFQDGQSIASVPSEIGSHKIQGLNIVKSQPRLTQNNQEGQVELTTYSNNKLTFRVQDQQQQHEQTRNEDNYQLPSDDSKPPAFNESQAVIKEFEATHQAKIDMQNFQSFEKRVIDMGSLESSVKGPLQADQPDHTMKSKGLRQSEDFQVRKSQRMHDLQNFNDTESPYQDGDEDYEQDPEINNDPEEGDEEERHSYVDDNQMPYSDQEEPAHQVMSNQDQGVNSQGQLLFTSNQHIFKGKEDSDEEGDDQFDHQRFIFQQEAPDSNQNQDQKFSDNDYDEDMPEMPIHQKKVLKNLSDEEVFNRLPKKYFAKEQEEAKTAGQVLKTINEMRQDFLGYISENNIHQKLEEIQNIIQPEKFIQRHFGDEDPTQVLYEDVAKNKVSKLNLNEPSQFLEGLRGSNPSSEFKGQHLLRDREENSNLATLEKQRPVIQEEENESSPDRNQKKLLSKLSSNNQSPVYSKINSTKNRSNKESSRQLTIREAKLVIRPPDSSIYSVGYKDSNKGPRVLRMADYFKQESSKQENADMLSDYEYKSDTEGQGNKKMFTQDQLNEDEDRKDQVKLSEQEREQLKQKMEQDILSNLSINFLFNKSDELMYGLIDQRKVFKLMLKIKEVANSSIEKGSKQIDYNEIVQYLKDEEFQYQDKLRKLDQMKEVNPYSEPEKTKLKSKEPFTAEMWTQVVDFMRKNPKILMQMLPDEEEDDLPLLSNSAGLDIQNAKAKNKVMQQIEEAKRWTRLQALSKNFLQRRDLIEAIDNQQNAIISSPPRILLTNKDVKKNNNHPNKQGQKKNAKINIENQKPQLDKFQDLNSGSETEQQDKGKEPVSRTYQKQYQYNSVSTAKNIYSNPAFIQADINLQNSQTPSSIQGLAQAALNRPIQSQQQPRGRSNIKFKKGSAMSTTMGGGAGDNTTLGTTATANATQLNFYRPQNLAGSQNYTIDDQNYPMIGGNATQLGKSSMMQQYNTGGEFLSGQPSSNQRRPITASAVNQGQSKNRNLGQMKPVLQQRLETFEITTNKSSKFSRGRSIGKKIATINYQNPNFREAERYESVNESAMMYSGQLPSKLEILSGQNNLNNSFAGPIVGQRFAPIQLGPSKNTKKYIMKIAPGLKENDMYPQILNPRGSSMSREGNKIILPRRLASDQIQNGNVSIPKINLTSKRISGQADSQRRSEVLNLSSTNLKDIDESAYEQTPQGAYPKFVKPSALQRASYSRRDSANDLESTNSQKQLHQSKKFINQKHYKDQTMQTKIGGVNNKLLISPHTGLSDPFAHLPEHEISRQDSEVSDKFSKKHLKMPVVDWAYTILFSKVLSKDTEFNKEQDMELYLEKEVDYVIDMMKHKYKDFKRSEIIRPFFFKSQRTIQELLNEQGLKKIFEKLQGKYKEVTIENTMKLLIRCKLAFHARQMLIDTLEQLINYELKAVEMKQSLDKQTKYRVPLDEFNEIKLQSQALYNLGHDLITKVQTLRSVHKQFKTPFIFKKKDYINYVKSEMNEIKKLISIFKVQLPGGPTEQDDLNKYMDIENSQQNLESSKGNILRQIEENKNETEEQSYDTS